MDSSHFFFYTLAVDGHIVQLTHLITRYRPLTWSEGTPKSRWIMILYIWNCAFLSSKKKKKIFKTSKRRHSSWLYDAAQSGIMNFAVCSNILVGGPVEPLYTGKKKIPANLFIIMECLKKSQRRPIFLSCREQLVMPYCVSVSIMHRLVPYFLLSVFRRQRNHSWTT